MKKLNNAMKATLADATMNLNGDVAILVSDNRTRKALIARGAEDCGLVIKITGRLLVEAIKAQAELVKDHVTEWIYNELKHYGKVTSGYTCAHTAQCWALVRAGKLVAKKETVSGWGTTNQGWNFYAAA